MGPSVKRPKPGGPSQISFFALLGKCWSAGNCVVGASRCPGRRRSRPGSRPRGTFGHRGRVPASRCACRPARGSLRHGANPADAVADPDRGGLVEGGPPADAVPETVERDGRVLAARKRGQCAVAIRPSSTAAGLGAASACGCCDIATAIRHRSGPSGAPCKDERGG
jgi:hypothetical protein